MDSNKLKVLVLFLIKRKLIGVGKSGLRIIDELKSNPNYNISENAINDWRKVILDEINTSYREIEETIEKLDIEFLK